MVFYLILFFPFFSVFIFSVFFLPLIHFICPSLLLILPPRNRLFFLLWWSSPTLPMLVFSERAAPSRSSSEISLAPDPVVSAKRRSANNPARPSNGLRILPVRASGSASSPVALRQPLGDDMRLLGTGRQLPAQTALGLAAATTGLPPRVTRLPLLSRVAMSPPSSLQAPRGLDSTASRMSEPLAVSQSDRIKAAASEATDAPFVQRSPTPPYFSASVMQHLSPTDEPWLRIEGERSSAAVPIPERAASPATFTSESGAECAAPVDAACVPDLGFTATNPLATWSRALPPLPSELPPPAQELPSAPTSALSKSSLSSVESAPVSHSAIDTGRAQR